MATDSVGMVDISKVQNNLERAVRGGIASLDSRIDEIIPTVEGGDLGMFLIALQAVEALRSSPTAGSGSPTTNVQNDRPLLQTEVEAALAAYILEYKDRFIYCTTDMAMKR